MSNAATLATTPTTDNFLYRSMERELTVRQILILAADGTERKRILDPDRGECPRITLLGLMPSEDGERMVAKLSWNGHEQFRTLDEHGRINIHQNTFPDGNKIHRFCQVTL